MIDSYTNSTLEYSDTQCGTTLPSVLTLQADEIYIRFMSDRYHRFKGFQATLAIL